MPYAPGVQDISGQLRAQGIAQAGQAWSQAIGSIGKSLSEGYQTYKQNKLMSDQAIAEFAATTRANPEILRYLSGASNVDDPDAPNVSPDVLKSFANIQSGDFSFKDAAVMNTFGKAYTNAKAKKIQEQHIAAQSAGNVADALTKLADLGYYANQPGSTISPEMVSNVQRFITSTVGGQAGQPQVAQRPSPDVLTSLAGVPQPAAEAAAQPAAVEEQPKPSVELPEGAIQLGRRSRQEQMAEAMKVVQTSNLPPSQQKRSLNTVLQDIQKRDLDLSRNIFFSDPQKADAYRAQLEKTSSAEGLKWAVDADPRTGYLTVKQIPSTFESSAAASARAGAIKGAEEKVVSVGKIADKDIAAADASQQIAYPVNRLLNLMESGQLKTGAGEEFKTYARSVGKSLGIPVDEAKLSAGNEAIAYMGQLLLPIYQIQKGTVSNSEQELYKSMTAGMAKDTKANEALLRVMNERIKVDRELGSLAEDHKIGEVSDKDFIKQRKVIRDRFDAKVREMAKDGGIPLGGDTNEVRLTVSTNPDGTVSAGKTPKYSVGDVVKQDGKTYRWNGTDFVEVN